MNGLAIAKGFYEAWGKPELEDRFPELVSRLAIGRIFGSDVLGADDELSKDHNWGPQFSVFLSAEDFSRYGKSLSETMNAAAPNPWNGYKLDGGGDQSVEVVSIPEFIETWIGMTAFPKSDADWLHIVRPRIDGGANESRESLLYFLKHGSIWVDGSGELSDWRDALATYPDRVWFLRLAEEVFRVFQHGEYNFVQRIAKRDDQLTVSVALGQFLEGIMRTYLLLNREFTPYWKWLPHEFRKLAEGPAIAAELEILIQTRSMAEKVDLVHKLSADLRTAMLKRGVIYGHADIEGLLPLFNAHLELLNKSEYDHWHTRS